jgi:L-glyceraldehyde 3-phosphate reductase
VEVGLLDVLGEEGVGCIGFTALAQGLLTDRYIEGYRPDGLRAKTILDVDEDGVRRLRGLADIARRRGQSLAQLALVWALRDERMTSLVIGASSVTQLEENVQALDHLELSADELAEIETYAVEAGVDIWRAASRA